MAVQTTTLPDPISPLKRLVGKIRNCARLRRDYRRTLADLSALSDRELADFGMSRHGLRLIAKRAVCG